MLQKEEKTCHHVKEVVVVVNRNHLLFNLFPQNELY